MKKLSLFMVLLGALSFTACTMDDKPVVIPDEPTEPEVEEMVPADLTELVATDGWGGGWCATQYAPAVKTSDGRTSQMMENYQGNVDATGVLLQQTIEGLENGKYIVELYANAFYTDGRGFASDMADGATDVAYVFANDAKTYLVGQIATATSKNGEYTIETEVTDGTLTIGLGKDKPGTNWHTIQIKSLTTMMPISKAYEKILPAAQELLKQKMSKEMEDILSAAIAAPMSSENLQNLVAAAFLAQISINSYKVIAAGAIADDKLDNWFCTNNNTFHINTWSVEGNPGNDPSGMVTPFIENWVGKPGPLGAGLIFYSLSGLNPGEKYEVSALIRAYSESGSDISGASFFVGTSNTDLATGTPFEYNGMKGIYGTYTAEGVVDNNGDLSFGVELTDPTFNWVAIKSVKITAK